MRLPRTAIVATGFILPSFMLGLIVVATQPTTHAMPQKRFGLSGSAISKSQTTSITSTSTSASTTAATPSIPRTQPSEPTTTHTTLSSTSASPANPPAAATPPPTPNNSTPIAATFAELSDWSAPILYTGTTLKEPAGTMVEYRYCTYYYSNGLTKQLLYQTQYGSSGAFDNDPNTGGWSVTVDPEIGCSIANAPCPMNTYKAEHEQNPNVI